MRRFFSQKQRKYEEPEEVVPPPAPAPRLSRRILKTMKKGMARLRRQLPNMSKKKLGMIAAVLAVVAATASATGKLNNTKFESVTSKLKTTKRDKREMNETDETEAEPGDVVEMDETEAKKAEADAEAEAKAKEAEAKAKKADAEADAEADADADAEADAEAKAKKAEAKKAKKAKKAEAKKAKAKAKAEAEENQIKIIKDEKYDVDFYNKIEENKNVTILGFTDHPFPAKIKGYDESSRSDYHIVNYTRLDDDDNLEKPIIYLHTRAPVKMFFKKVYLFTDKIPDE